MPRGFPPLLPIPEPRGVMPRGPYLYPRPQYVVPLGPLPPPTSNLEASWILPPPLPIPLHTPPYDLKASCIEALPPHPQPQGPMPRGPLPPDLEELCPEAPTQASRHRFPRLGLTPTQTWRHLSPMHLSLGPHPLTFPPTLFLRPTSCPPEIF